MVGVAPGVNPKNGAHGSDLDDLSFFRSRPRADAPNRLGTSSSGSTAKPGAGKTEHRPNLKK